MSTSGLPSSATDATTDPPLTNRTFRQKHLVPLSILVLVVGLFHWPVLSRAFTVLDSSPDIITIEVPDIELKAKALRQGIFPVWDPYAQGGRPMLAQMNPHLLDPFSTAFSLLPLKHGHLNVKLFDFYIVLLRCFAAIAAYFLLATLGLSPVARVFGGFLYAATGLTGTTTWPYIIIETIYPPLVFLFLFRSLTGKRPYWNAGMAGAMTGLSWFSGSHHVPLICSFAGIGALVAAMCIEKRWNSGMLRLVVYGGFLACVSAPQILPSVEMAPYVTRWVGLADPIKGSARVPFTAHLTFAVQPEHLLGIAIPGDLSINMIGASFLGIIALTFIALCFKDWSRSRVVRFLAIVALLGALLPVAQYNYLYGIFYALVPAMEKLREPGYWFFLLQISGCCLAAIGLDRFLRHRTGYRMIQSVLIRVLLILGGVIFLAAAWWGFTAEPAKQPIVHQYSLSGMISLLLATLLFLDKKKAFSPVAFGGFLIALLFIEHGDVSGWAGLAPTPPGGPHSVQILIQRRELGAFLKGRPDVQRIISADVPEALGDLNLLEDMAGHEGTMLTQFFRLSPWTFRAQQLYGVNYYVAEKPFDPRQVLVFSSPSTGLNVYNNPGVQPRTWSVHRLFSIHSDDEFGPMLSNPAFDLTQVATIKGFAPQLETCGSADDVHLVARSWFHSTIDATLACQGMVILNDNAYPGWYASLDGRSTHVYVPYGALRGVVVGAGKHRIEFRYRPWSFIIGLALFALAIPALILIGRADRDHETGLQLLEPAG